MTPRRAALTVACAAALGAAPARAGGPLGPNGTPIRTSNYAIDLSGGPVLAGTRVTAMGGAYVAIAEGVDGALSTPAAPAVRTAWSMEHVDYDAGLGLLFPNALSSGDFFNTGHGRTDLRRSNQSEFAFLTPGFDLSIGPWGIGVSAQLQRYGLRRTGTGVRSDLLRAQFSSVSVDLARAVDRGQLVGGVGLTVTALDVTTKNEILTRSGNVFTTRGAAFQAGLLWRPDRRPFRLGLAIRAPVKTSVSASGSEQADHDIVLGEPGDPNAIWMPSSVKRPWSADLGAALQLGPRPLNPPFIDPSVRIAELEDVMAQRHRLRQARAARGVAKARARHDAAAERAIRAEVATQEALDRLHLAREERRLHARLRARYRAMSRFYMLLSASLHIDGRVADAVGVESFLQGYVDRSGEFFTFSPHLGMETEAIPGVLKLQNGVYVEPSRFRGGTPRLHGTWGFDLKVLEWTVFGLAHRHTEWSFGAAADAARNYFSWGVSLGVWH